MAASHRRHGSAAGRRLRVAFVVLLALAVAGPALAAKGEQGHKGGNDRKSTTTTSTTSSTTSTTTTTTTAPVRRAVVLTVLPPSYDDDIACSWHGGGCWFGVAATLRATLTDATTGLPIQNRSVDFAAELSDGYVLTCSGATDTLGVATCVQTRLQEVVVVVRATFAGDALYERASASWPPLM